MTAPVYVTLQATFQDMNGQPGQGRVGWHPSNYAVQASTGIIFAPMGNEIGLDDTGSFSVPLLACDMNGVSFYWVLDVDLSYTWEQNSPRPAPGSGVWAFQLNAANGLTQTLAQ